MPPHSHSLLHTRLFFHLFLLFIFIHSSQTYHVSGNAIYDLEETSSSGLTSELASWSHTATFSSNLVTSCFGYNIVGGYGVLQSGYGYWSRTYSTPQAHQGLHIGMRFFQIDSWDPSDSDRFYLYMDGYTVPGWILTPTLSYGGGYSCGVSGYGEMAPMMVYAQIPHTGNTFSFTVQSYLDSNSYDESLGFRDITITLYPQTLTFNYCGATNGNPLSYAWCSCGTHQYMAYPQSGYCIECDNNCATCTNSPTYCTSCNPGWYMVGNTCYPSCNSPLYTGSGAISGVTYCYTPCPGQYVYWDGSCDSWCGYNWGYWSFWLQPSVESTYSRCDYPCYGTNKYLYWNNSCLDSCPEPLTTVSYRYRNLCSYPCAATEFLYWNKSCIASCPYPLSSETQGTYLARQFCWYTCDPSQYLYYNRSCIATCPYPLSPEVQGSYLARNYCWYACMPWQWLNWDQTCQETCVAPLWPEIHGTPARRFCWYPCTSEARFLYWNGTCLPECPKPLSTRYENGQWFCDYPCSSTQYLYWNGSCIGSCVLPLLSKIEGSPSRRFCYYPCPVNQFAYWDNTCQTSCDFPLVPNSEGNPIRQFCWYLCQTTEYLYWNGSCLNQCNFPLNPPRITNNRNFCDYPCLPNQYLFWNGSCLATCPNPLTVRVEGTMMKRNFCDFLCDPTKYIYWNGTCHNTCDLPLSIRTEGSATYLRKFCDYPCNGNQYLYWNGSCMSKCALPLITRIEVDKRYCDYLCPSTQVIYWDGTCDPLCDPPLIAYSQGSPSRNYCKYPCQNGQFLYPNGTCFETCAFPLTSSVDHSQLLCHYPCSSSSQYLYWNGSCLGSCDFPLSTRIENSNSWKYCDFPCEPSQYLYWNGTCGKNCKFPLTPRTTNNNLYCDFSCPISTDHLYWNGTCEATCPFPLQSTQEGTTIIRNYCASPCPTQHLYWNGTCNETCNFPLSTRINNGTHFCDYPCLYTEFLYWNASCANSCVFPLSTRIDAGNNYCDKPCKFDAEYAYWNGTCSPLCEFPLQTRNESSMLYCDYPCDPSEYLFFTGVCINNCTIPHQNKTEGETMLRNFCIHNCSSDEYLYWNGSCREVCHSPRRTIYNNSIRYCEKPCENSTDYYHETLQGCKSTCDDPSYSFFNIDYLACETPNHWRLAESYSYFDMFLHAPLKDNTLTVVHLVKSMQYVRYIDIKMPPRLERLASSKGRQILSIKSGITMWNGLLTKFTLQALPDAYHRLRIHSSFLVNYWGDLSLIIIGILLALWSLCMEKLARALKIEKAEVIFQTLRVLTKWNFVIIITAINIDDIILYTTLEIKSWDPNSSASTASFVSSVGFVLVILVFFGVICSLASQGPSWNRPMTSSKESCQVLFMPFRQNNTLARFFFPIYMLRIAIPTLIAISTENIPILNTVIQLMFSAGVVTFIVCIKPFTKKINYIQLVTFETAILVMNFFMVIISMLSENSKENYKVAVFLGDLVILGNDFINLMNLVFLVIKLHTEIKLIRQYTTRKIVTGNEIIGLWIQLLYVPIQQANMGFEEMTAFPTRVPLPRPQPRLPLEESEISIKKNTADSAFNEAETNNFLSEKEDENIRPEISFCQEETKIENKSPQREGREVSFAPQDPEKTPLERRLSQNKAIFKSERPPILLINGVGVSQNFQVEPLTFDKNATLDFSISENYSTRPKKEQQEEEDMENKTQGRELKLDETLDLNDNALFSKIQEDLAELGNNVGEQNGGRKRQTFTYLKKNEGISRRGYSSNPS